MASLKNSHYFASSPDCNILSNDPSHPELALLTLTPAASPIEIVRQREVLAVKEAEWSRRNASWKYWAYTCRDKKYQQVTVTISAFVSIKVKFFTIVTISDLCSSSPTVEAGSKAR